MGGLNSGGSNRKHAGHVEDCRRLDAFRLGRCGALEAGCVSTVSWGSGEAMSTIRVVGAAGHVRLEYSWRCQGGDWKAHVEHVHLDAVPAHFGGHRVYFRCPGCNRRVRFLNGRGHRYRCARCLDLVHASSRERPADRALRRSRKLRRQIGSEPGLGAPIGPKPKRMHWSRYNRIADEIRAADRIAHDGFLSVILRLRGRLGMEDPFG